MAEPSTVRHGRDASRGSRELRGGLTRAFSASPVRRQACRVAAGMLRFRGDHERASTRDENAKLEHLPPNLVEQGRAGADAVEEAFEGQILVGRMVSRVRIAVGHDEGVDAEGFREGVAGQAAETGGVNERLNPRAATIARRIGSAWGEVRGVFDDSMPGPSVTHSTSGA
jgi:hypothetical protein